MKMLTEYLKVQAERKKLQDREKELADSIKAALKGGQKVKNHDKEAYLIESARRSIEPAVFIERFGLDKFSLVADVTIKKVDALVKLGGLREGDVEEVTVKTAIEPRIGIRKA